VEHVRESGVGLAAVRVGGRSFDVPRRDTPGRPAERERAINVTSEARIHEERLQNGYTTGQSRRARESVRQGPPVPRISAFYGITVWMYWNEGQHARPHFHARYAGAAASFDLDGAVIAGTLPRRALALVAEWARMHRPELEANWAAARNDQPLRAIDPLP